jgi:hypothetical protein
LSHEQVCREKQGRLAKLARWLRGADAEAAAHRMPIHLRDHFAHRSRQIEFIGVWDTVRAFGGPFDELLEGLDKLLCLTFADTKLAENVSYGAQALAIDEARRTFSPILWEEDARVTQVWFTGAHSDVGGGYEKQGLAAQTLHWMMDQVGDRLRFTEHALEEARAEANPHGGLHDSRSGTALFYRYLPREIRGGTIDESVFDRLRHGTGDYAPTNLGCADGTGVERASFADSTNAKIPVVARLRSTLHALTVAALSIGVIAVALFVKAEPASTDPSEGIVDAIISGATAISTHVSPFDALDGRIHGLAALARTHWQVSLAILFAVAALVGICWLLERKQVGMAKRHWVTVRDRESGRDDRS